MLLTRMPISGSAVHLDSWHEDGCFPLRFRPCAHQLAEPMSPSVEFQHSPLASRIAK